MTTPNSAAFQLRHLANCGVLISCGAFRILVDGLMEGQDSFAQLPAPEEDLLLTGSPPYDNIHLLVFSHGHPDHFSPRKIRAFLASNPQARLLLPPGLERELPEIPRHRFLLTEDFSEAVRPFPLDPMAIRFVPMDHISFSCPGHCCIQISRAHETLLFTADMDFDQLPLLAEQLRPLNTPVIFANPILLGKEQWIREVAAWNPRHVFIYHIPPESTDEYGYRKMALRRQARAAQILPQLTLLTEPLVGIL